ncbi:hypothetical protein PHYSODRAFT_258322 [Phytophthora sojae]|uniref:ABC-type Fe3+ transport system n=1 Tax=Phytophthora sojae (strain P6497) TaxID=1094619 RepID=G4YH52_PHYSP|nr:hypothetical protein PHYSODRAFT_258322 [Phytophthora sojae]EGZ28075.1 hypothetical protein PHYSODRAFT_258322 [Phytophthora sojae]|eukprot:XP_009515350.1 hypothetical protein PHYSODRAFT_258322 [Phytophthora sojae]
MQLFGSVVAACALLSSVVMAKSAEETKSIDELYADAVAEGAKLVMYHGGDTPTQQNGLQEAFSKRFPDINFTMVVDYSKYHNVRIDNQLETDTLVPDVVALQTLQDFTRWAKSGVLLPYKPANFSKIHDSLRDKDGAWMAYTIFTFGFKYNSSQLDGYAAPTSPKDLTDPHWAGKIASSYPNDDDAVLFLYMRYVEKYGWDWMANMAHQNISFNRGTNVATKHPAAAKLFMNWVMSEEAQTTVVSSSPRTDIKPWDIPEANMAVFPKFMEDRAAAEEWRQTFTLHIGEVQGKPSPGWIGLHPGQ